MPKLTPAQMKKAVEEFKSKFTTGFYHGSPSNKIEAFDPTKSAKDPMYITPKATFVTRDPEFAESFLSMNNSGRIKSGSTMYPVSVNLGQHWHPDTPEGKQVIADFIEKYPKRVNLEKGLNRGDWTAVENSDFLSHLKDTGHDTFHVMEGGVPNVGVLEPHNIRGKFAEYNPEEAMNPDFMKAAGGSINLPEGGDLNHQVKSNLPDVSLDVRSMPSMTGLPGVGYMNMPQAAMARLQMEKELEHDARLRAGVSGMGMALPGQPGVKLMPGQMDVGYNAAVGPGRLDVSANRTINPVPGRGHIQGARVNYTIPFAAGGAVQHFDKGRAVRSGLTELMQLFKQQSGTGAAQRLEKAADLVPNLEHQYQPQALKEAFSGNRSIVSVMNPADFEKYAAPIPLETKSSLSKSRRIGEPGPGQDYTHMPLGTYDDYIKYLQQFSEPGGGGFRSMPYLQLGQRKGFSFPNIQGHEGRHRTDALTRQGNQSTLIGIDPRPELRDLPRNSQEEYLNALASEVGGRSPFVMPQQSEVKRGLIELPEMFEAGGKVGFVKKVLQHAKTLPFVHYSTSPNLTYLEPGMYGKGIKGAEAARLKDAPDIKPRSYFYVDRGEATKAPEAGLGSHKYQGTAENIYPLHEDPAGFSAIAKQKAVDPYMMQFGREVIDEPTHLNELERLIKGAGYRGYANDDVGLLFHPTEVQKVD
jgi:hypothetical protein